MGGLTIGSLETPSGEGEVQATLDCQSVTGTYYDRRSARSRTTGTGVRACSAEHDRPTWQAELTLRPARRAGTRPSYSPDGVHRQRRCALCQD